MAPVASTRRTQSWEAAKDEAALQMLRRALGISGSGAADDRNHVVTRSGTRDHVVCMALTERGHMLRIAGNAYNDWVDVFVVTDSGRVLAQRSAL